MKKELHEMTREERNAELERRRVEKVRILVKRKENLITLLRNVQTSNIHDKRQNLRSLTDYNGKTDENSSQEEVKKLYRACERAEAFLFRVAHKYSNH